MPESINPHIAPTGRYSLNEFYVLTGVHSNGSLV